MNPAAHLIALAALALASAGAPAQDAPRIALGIEGGAVLVSTGGEFVQASAGQEVAPGQRVLVSEGAAATLTYENGCRKALSSAGVYTVNADCDDSAAFAGGSSNAGVIAAVAGGVAVIAAVAGGGGGSSRPPPVSR